MGQVTPTQTKRTDPPRPTGDDRTTRQAAIWATVVALPLTALVVVLAVIQLRPETQVPGPGPTAAATTPTAATTPRPQSSTPVSMTAPRLSGRSATVCRALVAKLPATVRDLAQRPVSAGPEQNAAYGDPALTVGCGLPAPAFPPEDDVWVVNSVCWHPVKKPEAVVLTTVDREVPITVTVPSQYAQPLQWIAPISSAAVAAVPSTKAAVPSGCTG